MKLRPSHLLRATCLWTLFVWAVLVKNMLANDDGHELAFRLVHISLAVVSIGLAAALWPFAKRLDRRTPSDGGPETQSGE